ncbi:hypothetical protein [Halobellus marinus]|uniref:hypothetical protein n=1 Tax=Halobellus TaxID=1073986 RepID=UPI0028A5E625|nr:hypothetical protein [Halobellus sp. DFY28]
MSTKSPGESGGWTVSEAIEYLDGREKVSASGLTNCDTKHHTFIGWQENKSKWDVPFLSRTDWYYETKLDLYKHIDRHNAGLQNGTWANTNYETYWLNYNLIENAADRIGLTLFEKGKAIRIFTGLDLDEFGLRASEVAVAVCGWVLYEETERKTHPNARNNYDRLYQETIEAFDCRPNMLNKAFHRVGMAISWVEGPNWQVRASVFS